MFNNPSKKIAYIGLFSALVMISTLLIQIPTITKGYVHLGDALVYLSGIFLGPLAGLLSAGIGSALADLASGYAVYAPATFLVKGLDALVVAASYNILSRSFAKNKMIAALLAFTLGGLVMIAGYLFYESFLYGFAVALTGVPANLIQAITGVIIALPLFAVLEKNPLLNKLRDSF